MKDNPTPQRRITGSMRNPLFFEVDLSSRLRARQQRVERAVNDIPKGQFMIAGDQELVEHIVVGLRVEPLVLQKDSTTMKQEETQVDVSNDSRRIFPPGHSGPFHIPGTRIDVDIPFTGEKWIFRYRTNPFSLNPPQRTEVHENYLRISISLPHDADPKQFEEDYQRELGLIKECVKLSHDQVMSYNRDLPRLAQQAIANRRQRLGKHAGIASSFDIPLATKPGAPSIAPVKIGIRRPPRLPVPPETGLKPEPGIDDEAYERILHFIRHQGRTFERTPATFAVHGEEDLRNIILAQLNAHFEGRAGGEVFRGRGRTDISIEQENRAAFVAECKLWNGPAGLTGALDQLLGYLTWRDRKASLMIFNRKNKNFSAILKKLPDTVKRHALFICDLLCEEAGEWRVRMRSKEDEGRRVMVHIFAFNLYQDPEPRA